MVQPDPPGVGIEGVCVKDILLFIRHSKYIDRKKDAWFVDVLLKTKLFKRLAVSPLSSNLSHSSPFRHADGNGSTLSPL